MRIAIAGIRGIPANYGGFETFAEELSTRLVKRGHQVTVYGRSNNIKYRGQYYKGVRLIVLPTLSNKYLDTIFHTFLCTLHLLLHPVDMVLMPNVGNALVSWIPRLRGMPVVMNVDGLEWQRKKWGKSAKKFFKFSERLALIFPSELVSDAKTIQDYYWRKYHKPSTFIAYGANIGRESDPKGVQKFGLEPERYILYVSRLEPENKAHLVIKAFEQVKTNLLLVIVGDAPYAQKYVQELKKTRDPRIKFLGFVFGEGYKILQQNAYLYVHATEVGGTHPALIEGMGYGNCVLAYSTPENMEVIQGAGVSFSSTEDLTKKLQHLIDNPEIVQEYREKAKEYVRDNYNWETVTTQYEKLFQKYQKGKDYSKQKER